MSKAEEWSKHVSAQATSGLSVEEYCRGAGVAPSSFSYWKKRLKAGSEGRFVAVSAGAEVELRFSSGVVVATRLEHAVKIIEMLSCAR